MAISEPYSDAGTTISTTEYSLTNDSTTVATQTDDGIYQAFIYFASIAAGDEFLVQVKEKVEGSGAQLVVYSAVISGAQPGPLVTPALLLLHGWDITVKKLAGTDRSVSWSIRKVA